MRKEDSDKIDMDCPLKKLNNIILEANDEKEKKTISEKKKEVKTVEEYQKEDLANC